MIATSRIAKGAALTLAVGLHGVALLTWVTPAAIVQTEGAGGDAELQLGTRFADLVEGTLTAQSPEAVQTSRSAVEAPSPILPEASKPVDAGEPLTPLPAVTAPIAPAETTKSESPLDTIEAASEQPKQFASLRPPNRPKAPPAKAKPQKPLGNAQQTSKRGATTGTEKAKAVTQGAGTKAAADGTAAVSNYPGQVMRCISRVGRPRVRAKGAARIAFEVSSSGAVTGVTLAQSSGVAALDKEALALISRAGPCPAPPSGAQHSFAIQIKAR
ncbi:TonB family protein [Donghicola sp. XS_ASV15]|uniref:TonB family protein n=1 Tax=Donghicola sp. XS_ASV15 TaxID=3241295 RepID=UPI0035187EFF